MSKCGNCRLCCKLFRIEEPELVKPCHEWCKHSCDKGCAIYDERPETCRKFSCWWLAGDYPEKYRPDKVGVVVGQDTATDETGESVLSVVAYQQYPGAAMRKKTLPLLSAIKEAYAKTGMGFGVARQDGEGWWIDYHCSA